MRVLYVIDSLGAGGAERSTAAFLPLVKALGAEVSVATLYRAAEGSEDEVREYGIEVNVLTGRGWIRQVLELRRRIRAERPEIVHTALFASDVIGRLAAWSTPALVVSSLTNVPRQHRPQLESVPRWKRWPIDKVDLLTARYLTRRLHAVTPGVARLYSESFPTLRSKITVVERGRDPAALGERSSERRTRVREHLEVSPESPVLLNLGRHEHQKAQVDLVHAVQALTAEFPDVMLLVAGRSGQTTGCLEREIDDARLREHVRLLGHRTDVGDLMAAADVFVQSSLHEGAAGAALEAMAMGTPIVSTDVEGLEGVLEHELNCLLVPVGNPALMAAAVGRVLGDPELSTRLGAAAREDFLSRFTLRRSAEGLIELYRSVLDG